MAMGVMRYFSSVEGSAVPRFGSSSFIGAVRSPAGFVWNPEAVVAIPAEECDRYLREYRRVLAAGALRERKASDHAKWAGKQAADDAAVVAAAQAETEPTTRVRRRAAAGE